jgi:hypothetical protein
MNLMADAGIEHRIMKQFWVRSFGCPAQHQYFRDVPFHPTTLMILNMKRDVHFTLTLQYLRYCKQTRITFRMYSTRTSPGILPLTLRKRPLT